MALKITYPYDKNGRPVRIVGNTSSIFDDKGVSLAATLSQISGEASRKRLYCSSAGFPTVGDPDCLYCDETDFYVWDTVNQGYKKIISETASSALEKAHTHANKTILDAITRAYTSEEAEVLSRTSAAAASAIQTLKIGETEIAKSGTAITLPLYPTRKSLELERVDNTRDLDKPISSAGAAEFVSVRNELAAETARAQEAENNITSGLSSETGRAMAAEETIRNTINTNQPKWDDKYTRNEVDNKFSALETAIDWKEAVNTYNDLSSVYPHPDDGWTVNVKDTDYTYRWNGAVWIAISANAIPKATQSVDGLLSREDKKSYDSAYIHTSNKSNPHGVTKAQVGLGNVPNLSTNDQVPTFTLPTILENITSGQTLTVMLGKIAKVTETFIHHKADSNIHITTGERTAWNDSDSKKHTHGNKGVIDKLTQAMLDKLTGIAAGAEVNVQSDWNMTDTGADGYIKNKPSSMPASDVASWAKASVKPAYSWTEIGNKPSSFVPASHTHTKSQVSDMPTKLGDFENDAGYLTAVDIDTSQNHTHANKTTLDKITQTMLDKLAGIAEGANKYVHPATAGNKHIPAGGLSGQILRWNADGTAIWGTDDNTDSKMTQTNTTKSADYRLLLSGSDSDSTETTTGRKSTNFLANPATGEFYATGYRRTDLTGRTLDLNTLTISTGAPAITRYIEKTSGGASNITNIPVSGQPFLLDVELIRWISATDYVTMQTYRNAANPANEYVRYCTNGTWGSWVARTFTDTKYTHPNSGAAAGIYRSVTVNTQGHVTSGTNPTTLAGYGITDAAAKDHNHTYLPLSGGTVTGDIKVKAGDFTATPIKIYPGDVNGAGLVSQAGGLYMAGSGESAQNLYTTLNPGASTERTFITSDQDISLVTNCQTIANRKTIVIDNAGKITAPGGFSGTHSPNDLSGAVPISKGGTGAVTAETARINLGAASSSHTHNYAGSSSAGGSASTAVKVNNSLDINGQLFNGSAAVDVDIMPLVIGTQTATTGTWTGSASSVTALSDGLSIRYWLPYNGSGNATLNLTLKGGTTTGAVDCYWKGTSRLTTHFQAGTIIILTYRKDVPIAGSTTKYTGWWAAADYNSDTNYRLRLQNVIKAKAAIAAYKIITGNASGYSHLASGTAFDIRYPILYTQSSIASGGTNDNVYMAFNGIPMSNVFSFTATAYSMVYIKGTLSGNSFTPNATVLTCTQPASSDGFCYMLLGYAYSTSAFYLLPSHPLYQFINGAFQEISNSSIYSAVSGSAEKWKTARNIRIGNAAKSVDGSKDITFTSAEIGLPTEIILKNISVPVSSFTNLAANYVNSNILANQIPDVIFNKASGKVAAKAGISVSTEAGKLVLTALRLPESDLTIESLILKDAG